MSRRVVHYLGPPGTYCHQAALGAFTNGVEHRPCPNIISVFEALREQPLALGVVPLENSIEGSVSSTLESLLEFAELTVIGEAVVEVEHCLISEGTLPQITSVKSHPHALPQCKRWLRANLPKAAWVSVASTALAAQEARGVPEVAAIASELAAYLAGVPILARGIQDRARNATRFLALGRETPPPTGRDKTSIVFGAPHEKGALYRALGIFDHFDINLSRIESRPSSEQIWEYVFFADLEGHTEDDAVRAALAQLAERSPFLRVLGSYPRAELR